MLVSDICSSLLGCKVHASVIMMKTAGNLTVCVCACVRACVRACVSSPDYTPIVQNNNTLGLVLIFSRNLRTLMSSTLILLL